MFFRRANSKSRVAKSAKAPATPVIVEDEDEADDDQPREEKQEECVVSSNIVSSSRVSKSSTASKSSRVARVSQSSKVSESSIPPPSAHILPERVTRSRSRSILRDPVPPQQRVGRLDIQSEDEDETGEGRGEKHSTSALPDKAKSQFTDFPFFSGKWISSKEGKGILASIVLLVILIIIHKLVATMQSETLSDNMIVLLAYALSPVRGVVEGVRAMGGGQVHSQKVVKEIDYDMLANKIINSDKFKQVIEQVSGEKIVSYDTQLELKIKHEVDQISESIKNTQNMYSTLDTELAEAKTFFNTEIEKAASVLRVEIGKESSLESDLKIDLLDQQIQELKHKLEGINQQILEDSRGSQNQISQDLEEIKVKLKDFEESKLKSAIDMQKCCKTNADVNLVIENKLNAILSDEKFVLKQTLNDNFVKTNDFDEKLKALTSNIESNLETHKMEILEETRKDIEITMNEEVIKLKENFSKDLLSEVESSIPSARASNSSHTEQHSASDVRRIVREALTKYDADKTGLFDFALESAGGSIVTTKCTEPYQLTSAVMSVWGVPFWWDTNSPR